MVPIFEQGKAVGIGHSYESFVTRFKQICEQHLREKRAKAFAFLFYDFTNEAIRKILKDQGGFAQLDRLSGTDLSVFYLHSNSKILQQKFNQLFLYAFEVDTNVSMPLVLFVKFDAQVDEITDLQVVFLEQSNYQYAFQELYETMRLYIERLNSKDKTLPSTTNKIIPLLQKLQKISIDKFIGLFIQETYKHFFHL